MNENDALYQILINVLSSCAGQSVLDGEGMKAAAVNAALALAAGRAAYNDPNKSQADQPGTEPARQLSADEILTAIAALDAADPLRAHIVARVNTTIPLCSGPSTSIAIVQLPEGSRPSERRLLSLEVSGAVEPKQKQILVDLLLFAARKIQPESRFPAQ